MLFLYIIALILLCLSFLYFKLSSSCREIRRIDPDGALYSLVYKGNYYSRLARLPLKLIRSGSCSAFAAVNENGEAVTGRNYDMPHMDQEKNITGLNIVVHLKPEGKYASVNCADAAWVSYLKIPYHKGSLDDGKTTHLPLFLIPYLCMDGMNEKGLTCSILYLDVKEGETAAAQSTAGLETVTINEMCRFIIDQCADVEEAVSLAKNYNMHNILKSDYHLFVSDAKGESCVLEWRYNTLYITYTDACTNFYVAFDDAEDCYYSGELKERFIHPSEKTHAYHYGYGHGYDRFAVMTQRMDEKIDHSRDDLKPVISTQDCMHILEEVSQQYNGMLTSYTQYSCVYNQKTLVLDLCVQQDYSRTYHFTI